MEAVLLDTMYKIPSLEAVSKVIIDEAVIQGESEPLLMYENAEPASKSVADEQFWHRLDFWPTPLCFR